MAIYYKTSQLIPGDVVLNNDMELTVAYTRQLNNNTWRVVFKEGPQYTVKRAPDDQEVEVVREQDPCHCPTCGGDWATEVIPEENLHLYGGDPMCPYGCGRPHHYSGHLAASIVNDRAQNFFCVLCGTETGNDPRRARRR